MKTVKNLGLIIAVMICEMISLVFSYKAAAPKEFNFLIEKLNNGTQYKLLVLIFIILIIISVLVLIYAGSWLLHSLAKILFKFDVTFDYIFMLYAIFLCITSFQFVLTNITNNRLFLLYLNPLNIFGCLIVYILLRKKVKKTILPILFSLILFGGNILLTILFSIQNSV